MSWSLFGLLINVVLRCGRGPRVLAKNGVLDTATFVFDAVHEAPRPDEFGGEQAQAEKNSEPAGTGRDEHDHANEKKAKAAANLVERRLEHDPSTNRHFEDGIRDDKRQTAAIPIDLREAQN